MAEIVHADTFEEIESCIVPGVSENDDVYYWDTVRFSVQGCVFKVPQHHFIKGSEYFDMKYLQPASSAAAGRYSSERASGPSATVILEGITAQEFRTFLKLLFPMHTTSTKITLTKPEWLTILTVSTLWHFHAFRKLAIQHLEVDLAADPIEQIQVGRAAYVPRWVESGYETLVLKEGAISEEESEAIGHLTTVRLYIVRQGLGGEQAQGEGGSAKEQVKSRFREELLELGVQEAARRTQYDIEREERERQEEERLKEERERQEKDGKAKAV